MLIKAAEEHPAGAGEAAINSTGRLGLPRGRHAGSEVGPVVVAYVVPSVSRLGPGDGRVWQAAPDARGVQAAPLLPVRGRPADDRDGEKVHYKVRARVQEDASAGLLGSLRRPPAAILGKIGEPMYARTEELPTPRDTVRRAARERIAPRARATDRPARSTAR